MARSARSLLRKIASSWPDLQSTWAFVERVDEKSKLALSAWESDRSTPARGR